MNTNFPNFLREGDQPLLRIGIHNNRDTEITGQITLEISDVASNSSVDGWFQNIFPTQYFTISAHQFELVDFPIQVPYSFNKTIHCRLKANDGRNSTILENSFPILPNRIIKSETIFLPFQNSGESDFRFTKLANADNSITHQSLKIIIGKKSFLEKIQTMSESKNASNDFVNGLFKLEYGKDLTSKVLNELKEFIVTSDTLSKSKNAQLIEENKSIIELGKIQIPIDLKKYNYPYFEKTIAGSQLDSSMASIKIICSLNDTSKNNSVHKKSLDSNAVLLTWNYLENYTKSIHKTDGLSLEKKLWRINYVNGENKKTAISSFTKLKIGDTLQIQIIVNATKDFNYIHIEDPLAACMKINKMELGKFVLTPNKNLENNQETHIDIFEKKLGRGKHVFNYIVYLNKSGNFSLGNTILEEFVNSKKKYYTESMRLEVE